MKGDNLFSIVRGEDYLLSGERLIYDLQVLQKKKRKKNDLTLSKVSRRLRNWRTKRRGRKATCVGPALCILHIISE